MHPWWRPDRSAGYTSRRGPKTCRSTWRSRYASVCTCAPRLDLTYGRATQGAASATNFDNPMNAQDADSNDGKDDDGELAE